MNIIYSDKATIFSKEPNGLGKGVLTCAACTEEANLISAQASM